MPAFHLYSSNRIENLIPVLGDILCLPRDSIFQPDTVIVQNKGMQQWLSLQLSEQLKICAFCEFPFLNAFFKKLFLKILPEIPEHLTFDPEFLVWNIYQQIPKYINEKDFGPLKAYLIENDPVKLFQLSLKITDIFDQYSMYRPETVCAWEDDKEEAGWQSILWNAMVNSKPSHRIHLRSMLIEKINNNQFDHTTIPQKICFFGISSLPSYFLDLIGILSKVTDIHYFLLNPSVEYWDDIISEKELQKILRKKKRLIQQNVTTDNLHYDIGNYLLSSFGSYGRDFISRLHELECSEDSFPVSINPHNLLSYIQSDILTLSKNSVDQKKEINRNDKSIQIHSCHSPLREVEILYDNILNFFQLLPGLKPSEIIIMAPDIEKYAPYIKNIFDAAQTMRLPYSLADRAIKDESVIVEGYIELLEIITSRFSSTSVVNLLEIDELREKFELSAADITFLKKWIKYVGIRWGLDAESKERISVPATVENSWVSGINQLLMGFALPAKDLMLFKGIAGSNLIEGSAADLLGKFLNFFTSLKKLHEKVQQSYSLEDWSKILLDTLNEFFMVSIDKQYEIINVSKVFSELSLPQQETHFEEKVSFDVIKSYLQQKLTATKLSQGFLNGGITFCSIMPMRGIPFRIIGLLGLNESVFPRRSHNVSWDLIAASPKKGDRSLEAEDRYVFLETLLSARDIFYISYIGQNIQKNITQHPSVCVEELLDYINNNYQLKNDPESDTSQIQKVQTVRDFISFHHRLHGFNPEYYKQRGNLFSYSDENLSGAKTLLEPKRLPEGFFLEPLSPPPDELKLITLDDLNRFFGNPSKYLLQKRLGVLFSTPDEELKENEPFEISGLEKYGLTGRLTDITLKNAMCYENSNKKEINENAFYEYFQAINMLPHGTAGQYSFKKVYTEVIDFTEKIKKLQIDDRLENISTTIECSTVRLDCEISSIWPQYMLLFRNAAIKPKDYIAAWLKHLCLNIYNSNDYPKTTILITNDAVVTFSPEQNARAMLNNLIELFIKGLTVPLSFFPQCSWEYAEALLRKQKTNDEALIIAYKSWSSESKYTVHKESEDPYIQICFSDKNPIDQKFTEITQQVFNPLINNLLLTSDKE